MYKKLHTSDLLTARKQSFVFSIKSITRGSLPRSSVICGKYCEAYICKQRKRKEELSIRKQMEIVSIYIIHIIMCMNHYAYILEVSASRIIKQQLDKIHYKNLVSSIKYVQAEERILKYFLKRNLLSLGRIQLNMWSTWSSERSPSVPWTTR